MTFYQDLEPFVDKYFSEQMLQLNIPGAVFVLVKGDKLLLNKGYGFANLDKKIVVTPDQTLFRVGSISKLLTATAIMQLVEAGQLNLFEDINSYLKEFKIAAKYSQPITVANLLTHTAGFEEHSIGLETLNPSELIPLGKYFANRIPPRVMPPGKTISYSNHGMGLAGYLVEVVAGMPFEQYIQENIFQPLEMYHSSFQLPAHLADDLAVGYEYEADNYQAVPFSYIKIPPGGSLNATATDIAHFIMAHLQNGCYKNRQILNQTTALEMHQQQFTNDPRLPGFTYGFYEDHKNNQRIIQHGGTVRGFASLLFLLPEQDLGFFIAGNSLEFKFVTDFADQFLDKYYPVSKSCVVPQALPNFAQRSQDFTGYYRNQGESRNTIQKISALFSQIRVSASEDSLVIPDFSKDEESDQWVEVEPLLFQRIDDDSLLAFRKDNQGRITYLFMGISTFEKLRWYETSPFHFAVLGFCVLVFLGSCIISLGWGMFNISQIPDILALAIASLNLIFIIGFVLASSHPNGLTYGVPKIITILLTIPIITAALTLGLIMFTILSWNNQDLSLWQRLDYSLISLASITFTFWLRYWNLWGFKHDLRKNPLKP
ncbi:serine hydrolase domain-containing protein [Nodularia sp. UHCC 0506]|uniref:serine hydrolase domain-containing protein n=1 Tax=Nodularia sp. UHCC 0506 TaxID=3110243 RepID=UPI002B1EFCA9|nr:serine hydrolase domain-containing protein [Nodularia sp. UHCC 0506]MEA5515387.1 serine hydrolase domain-containing protein [Nodularia sp. UHCC 0506]